MFLNNIHLRVTDLSGHHPAIELYSVAVSAVHFSASGANWFSINEGMPNAIAWDVVLNQSGTTLYAFTHGRGVWRANVKSLPATPTAKLQFLLKTPIALPTIHLEPPIKIGPLISPPHR
jgi:hypothetical protein